MNNKQKIFVEEYVKCWNAAEAARRAGYSKKIDKQYGYTLLNKPYIKEAVQQRIDEIKMSADEALILLAKQARGDLGEFMDAGTLMLDIRSAKDKGQTAIIKKLKQRTVTKLGKNETDEDVEIHDLEIELYDAQSALDKILKAHGMFINKVDLTTNGDKLEIGVNVVDYRIGLAALAPRSIPDSDPPSQDEDTGDGSEMG